ncbi:sugar ABC transporter ATP-binding protein [Paenibacillus antibioticophila]|uniref:Sugar ABC transporter ATP-binding protein n=1 Tax=Paenibacillus antibioticophila TaxID=1274374 RepID=A0A919XU18_9BACL|nr:carbohydrate ABC transporter permease [Paenibacillus antibioticophila]GIO36667.1 sugar ABC transporter ATP-binding protein [Paenibacillus antibioticophila]
MNLTARMRRKPDEPGIVGKLFFYLFLIIGALVSVFPFYWMFVVATNDKNAAFHIPPLLIPGGEFFNNFARVLERTDFFRSMFNSLVVATSVTASVVFLCTLAGFAFAKYEFPMKKILFVFVIATMLVPAQLGVLPQYVIMAKLHWIDSYKALIVPAMVNAFGIFWMRQYISSAVHSELLEAGRIDGGGHFRIFWNIAIPVVTPAMATLGILNFMNVWNDFFWPLVVLKNRENYTIQLALQQLFTNKDGIDFGMIMSATFTATLPLLVVFLLFSRWVIAGLTSGAIKS